MSEIETEILKLTKIKRKKNEDEQAFLNRVVAKMADLDDDDWENLSEEAQEWSNEASEIFNANKKKKKKKDLPTFPEDDDEEEEDDEEDDDEEEGPEDDEEEGPEDDEEDDDEEEEDDDEEEEEKPKAKSKKSSGSAKKTASKKADTKKTAGKKDAPKKTTAKKSSSKKASGGEKKKGGTVIIKEIMVEYPNINTADLTEELNNRGYELTDFTISTVRGDTRQTFKVLKDLGVLSKDFVKRIDDKD